MQHFFRIGLVVCTAFAAASALPGPQPTGDPPAASGSVAGPLLYPAESGRVEAQYADWASRHEANGGDRNVVIGLGWAKGLSPGPRIAARGQARVDLVGRSISVEVHGLEDAGDFAVWLVDNQPVPGDSSMPEPHDRKVSLGRLAAGEGGARLEAALEGADFSGFEIDLVVVARAGKDPSDGLLYGSPGLFQRLYTASRTAPAGRSAGAGRFPLLALAAPGVAHADGGGTGVLGDSVASLDPLVQRGARLFFRETFNGNGRTCGSCHRAEDNFTISPAFIATLPNSDPLFVAEFTPALRRGFEVPVLMRRFGLILENTDGFDDDVTDNVDRFTMRGVPHTIALNTSLTPAANDGTTQPPNERTGWSGDGAPGNGTLFDFATGAVTQHFPKTLRRKPGVDFRLPTDSELAAMEAFQRSIGRDRDLALSTVDPPSDLNPVPSDPIAREGKALFLAQSSRCNGCHSNAGANAGFGGGGNRNFNTGVEALPSQPARLVYAERFPNRPQFPIDGGFGQTANPDGSFGNGTFNTTPLVEAADTGPFFHSSSVDTIEEAVAFYDGPAFNNSPAAAAGGVALDATQIRAIAAFLRVINALENIREARRMGSFVLRNNPSAGDAREILTLGAFELEDADQVLSAVALNPNAVRHIREARELYLAARAETGQDQDDLIERALEELRDAKRDLTD